MRFFSPPLVARRLFLAAFCVFAAPWLATVAHAQLRLDLKLRRHTFLPYEPVEVVLTITNFAGRDVVFENQGDRQWLDFELTAARQPWRAARRKTAGRWRRSRPICVCPRCPFRRAAA